MILICGGVLLAMRQFIGFGALPCSRPREAGIASEPTQAVVRAENYLRRPLDIASWALESAVILVAAQALGIEISIAAAVAVTAFTILFQVFHVTPGGIECTKL